MREHAVAGPKGRTLKVAEDGDPGGIPIFGLHGTPGSRVMYSKHVTDAATHGVRLLAYDRPGYGESTTSQGRSVGDAAADVAAIADELGIERFGVWGHSGGGPHALACAALLPRRVVAAAALSGLPPPGAEGYDPLEGMGEFNVEDYRLMMSDRSAWEAKQESDRTLVLQATPDQLLEMLSSLLSDVDRAVITPELGKFLQTQMHEGLRHNANGIRDDSVAFITAWGFEVSSIRVPIQIWHGAHDRMAPYSGGQWVAAHVPGAEVHLEPDEGHISIYERRIPEVHRWIASQF